MKKLMLLVTMILSTKVLAASTGTIYLSGTVAAINELSIAPTTVSTNLNITSGEVNTLVAVVTETSNSLNGYKINMKSLNASKLAHTIDNSKSTTYTISYDGNGPFVLTTIDQVVKNSGSLGGLTTDTSDVKINVSAYPTAPAGVYSDIITVSIVAN